MKRSKQKQLGLTFSRNVVVRVSKEDEKELVEAVAELLLAAAAARAVRIADRRDDDESEADR